MCDHLGLSETASRCTDTHSTTQNIHPRKHTHTHPGTSRHMSSEGQTRGSLFSLNGSVILTTSDRRRPMSPNSRSLMMFYHALGIMFPFVCMFEKIFFSKKHLTSEFLCQLKGRLIRRLPDSHPPPPPLFLSSPRRSLFSRSYIFTKVPFSLLSFHQRLSKGALILKAGLA